jgi:hypothetical protein
LNAPVNSYNKEVEVNIRLADLKLVHLLVGLVVAACVAFGALKLIHEIHASNQASHTQTCLLNYNVGSLAEQLCEQGKLQP